MKWSEKYGAEKQPTTAEITEYICNPLWDEMNKYLQETYKAEPKIAYSKCSSQPGWNVKYQKSGRSLCTLYPMEGYFIALVTIGERETNKTELLLPLLSHDLQELYSKTPFSCGGRWLMISVADRAALNDITELIKIRVKPKK